MRVLFSVYNEDHDTEERTFRYSRVVKTSMVIDELDEYLQLYDGFHSVLEVGHNLCFWDIYCFFEDTEELSKKIDSIPHEETEAPAEDLPSVLMVEEFDPGNTEDAVYPDAEKIFAYRLTRYECGASGFHAVVMFAANHPWAMVFIGGAIWDFTKCLGDKFRKAIKKKFGLVDKYERQKRVACLSIKNFYRNFSRMTKVPEQDCQIVFLNRRKNNVYDVRVRTVSNECYHVKCNSRGKIDSIKLVDLNTLHSKW